jgi:hypothetical protein
VGEVVVSVVREAELEDLAAEVFREGAGAGGVVVGGIGSEVGVEGALVAEAGDGVVVVVDADEDAFVGVGRAGAREEAERREVAGLPASASASFSSSSHGGGGGEGGWGFRDWEKIVPVQTRDDRKLAMDLCKAGNSVNLKEGFKNRFWLENVLPNYDKIDWFLYNFF